MVSRKWSFGAFALACALSLSLPAVPAFAAQPEIVQFRLGEWKTQHFDDDAQAKEFHAALTKLGVEAKAGSHGDHVDVTYRCPKWRSLQAESHDSAHGWENWLKQAGFETKHQH